MYGTSLFNECHFVSDYSKAKECFDNSLERKWFSFVVPSPAVPLSWNHKYPRSTLILAQTVAEGASGKDQDSPCCLRWTRQEKEMNSVNSLLCPWGWKLRLSFLTRKVPIPCKKYFRSKIMIESNMHALLLFSFLILDFIYFFHFQFHFES